MNSLSQRDTGPSAQAALNKRVQCGPALTERLRTTCRPCDHEAVRLGHLALCRACFRITVPLRRVGRAHEAAVVDAGAKRWALSPEALARPLATRTRASWDLPANSPSGARTRASPNRPRVTTTRSRSNAASQPAWDDQLAP